MILFIPSSEQFDMQQISREQIDSLLQTPMVHEVAFIAASSTTCAMHATRQRSGDPSVHTLLLCRPGNLASCTCSVHSIVCRVGYGGVAELMLCICSFFYF